MQPPLFPSLYQINTRVWGTELSRKPGRPATLDEIPDAEVDRLASLGFDWVWLLSVWQTGQPVWTWWQAKDEVVRQSEAEKEKGTNYV